MLIKFLLIAWREKQKEKGDKTRKERREQEKGGEKQGGKKGSSNPAQTKPSLALCVLLCHEFTAFLLFGLFFWIRTGPIRPYLEHGATGESSPSLPPQLPPSFPPQKRNMQLCVLHFPKYSCYATKCAKTARCLPDMHGYSSLTRSGGGEASSMSCVFVAVFCFAYE